MAKFTFNGMDEISATFDQLAQISDDDKMAVIMPAAEFLLERQREKILSIFHQRTGALANALSISKRSDENGSYAYIYLKGKHPGSSTGKRHKRDSSGKIIPSGKYSGTNAEVGWVLEHGSPRIAPRHWMESANEESANELIELQQDAWNDMLDRKGL